jgi:hypothetical protein
VLLPDHILIELGKEVFGLRHGELGGDFLLFLMELFFEDAAADVDATVTDVNSGTGDKFFDFSVALSAEGTHREIGSSCHMKKKMGGRGPLSFNGLEKLLYPRSM